MYLENDDPCEKAFQLVKCYVEFHPEVSPNFNTLSFPEILLCPVIRCYRYCRPSLSFKTPR